MALVLLVLLSLLFVICVSNVIGCHAARDAGVCVDVGGGVAVGVGVGVVMLLVYSWLCWWC